MRKVSVTSEKLWRERRNREKNQSDVVSFRLAGKGEAHDLVIARVDHQFVSEVPDVLNWWGREFSQKFTLLNILGEKKVVDVSS